MLYFHFYSVLCIFFYSLRDFLFDPGLFRSMMFNFQVFGDFPVFLLLMSSLIPYYVNETKNGLCILLPPPPGCLLLHSKLRLSSSKTCQSQTKFCIHPVILNITPNKQIFSYLEPACFADPHETVPSIC